MIVPMKKAIVIVQSKDANSTMEKLRSLGALHIENERPPSGKDINMLKEDMGLVNETLRILSAVESAKKLRPETGRDLPDWRSTAGHIIDLWKRLEQLEEYSRSLSKNISDWEAWGDFEPQAIKKLAEQNIYIRLYQIPTKQMKDIPPEVIVEKISSAVGIINCLAISRKKIDMPFKEMTLPKMGLEKMKARLCENNQVIKTIEEDLQKHISYQESLLNIKNSLAKELEFQEAIRGMGQVEDIMYLKGYIPYDTKELLLDTAGREKWGIVIEEPPEEDRVPTLIRNPRWIALLSPIFKVLEIVPGYRELDISLWFLMFFSIFFGILIGDAGYGLIYLVLTFVAQRKWKAKLKESSIFKLFYLLGFSAVVWGVLSGTFFGQEWLPKIVKPLIPALRSDRNVQIFCFFLGALHLSIAHIWRALLKVPSLVALVDMGWMLILWGAFFLAKTLILGDILPSFVPSFVIIGAILVVFFTNPRRNVLKGIGAGMGNLLLNLVNNFTDVVSYIRLFAVGLATVAVADSFNRMAMEIGFNNIITGILTSFTLLLGHALNVLLGPMSVLVHGVRLNVLEFSNHLDIKWSGFPYRPLKK